MRIFTGAVDKTSQLFQWNTWAFAPICLQEIILMIRKVFGHIRRPAGISIKVHITLQHLNIASSDGDIIRRGDVVFGANMNVPQAHGRQVRYRVFGMRKAVVIALIGDMGRKGFVSHSWRSIGVESSRVSVVSKISRGQCRYSSS